MIAWIKRIWSWLKADLLGREFWEEEERKRQEQEERALLARKGQNRQTDGFREVG
jgi:hypothetical protein